MSDAHTTRAPRAATTAGRRAARSRKDGLPGQVVLVLQGGGALGAYQVGVFEALHDAGIEPDWVIGTSIGAINAAVIAGNPPADRMDRLNAFWRHVEVPAFATGPLRLARIWQPAVQHDDADARHSGVLRAQCRGAARRAR